MTEPPAIRLSFDSFHMVNSLEIVLVLFNFIENIRLLLLYGAKVQSLNNANETPLMVGPFFLL